MSTVLSEPDLKEQQCEPLVFKVLSGKAPARPRYLRELEADSGSMEFLAGRLALPRRAALVPLDEWLSPLTAARWTFPPKPEEAGTRVKP